MAYDPAPLLSYVRFYWTVVTQLKAACEHVERAHATAKAELLPFHEPLVPVRSQALEEAMAEPHSWTPVLSELWAPQDPENLSGLCDVYEVIGRFSFQGEENKNLGRIQSIVAMTRNEIAAQRKRMDVLAQLPEAARQAAQRIQAEEVTRAGDLRREKLDELIPLAESVRVRAKQTMDAMRGVPLPDLSNADTAAEEYKKYVQKLDHVYQTCLPYLRKAISSLYAFVNAEPGAAWPETLPLIAEMPAELVSVPPMDSAELNQARAHLTALDNEEIQMGRARDEIATGLARLEGEMAAMLSKDNEVQAEMDTAAAIFDFASASEQSEVCEAQLSSMAQQKAQRLQSAGEVWQKQKATEAGIAVLEEELRGRSQEIAQVSEKLAKEQGDEPVLFGKDDWRQKVAALSGQLDQLRAIYSQRVAALNQLKIDMSAIAVQVQNEQAQGALLERTEAEAQAKLSALRAQIREIGTKLGSQRPVRKVAPADAQAALGTLQQGRIEIADRIARLKTEMRRQKEENVRVLTRQKQIGIERQQFQSMLQNAQVLATEGREAALRQLALQRRAAVERHVNEVLSGLEKSLSAVDVVFVDPVREVLLKSTEPNLALAEMVLAQAEKVTPVVQALSRALMPVLESEEAALSQIQREFCDMAVVACKAAWN